MGENTHITTQPNKKPPTKLDALKIVLFKDGMKQVQNYYNGNKDEANRFLTAAIEYVRKVPKLLECEPTSLMMAFVQSAQFRFMPSSVGGEAYVIPYGSEAKFQLGYQGIVTLLYRTNKVKAISANIVYKNDDFEYEEGLSPKLKHKFSPFADVKDRGEPVGVYTVADMGDNIRTFKVMGKDSIMGIKNLSKAKGSKESPWNSDKDPENWMWKKTCLIQHAKLLPKTQELQQAIEIDYEGEGIDKPVIDAGGIATAKVSHAPEASQDMIEEPGEEPHVDY